MTERLSDTMRRSLAAIKAAGGIARLDEGEVWVDDSGVRLAVRTTDWCATAPVTTRTVHALERRGFLRKVGGDFPTYRLTEKGRNA